jgi:hypothetical protein
MSDFLIQGIHLWFQGLGLAMTNFKQLKTMSKQVTFPFTDHRWVNFKLRCKLHESFCPDEAPPKQLVN